MHLAGSIDTDSEYTGPPDRKKRGLQDDKQQGGYYEMSRSSSTADTDDGSSIARSLNPTFLKIA